MTRTKCKNNEDPILVEISDNVYEITCAPKERVMSEKEKKVIETTLVPSSPLRYEIITKQNMTTTRNIIILVVIVTLLTAIASSFTDNIRQILMESGVNGLADILLSILFLLIPFVILAIIAYMWLKKI